MNYAIMRGWTTVVIAGLVLLAVGVLVGLQWANHADLTAYGPPISVNLAILMLASLAGGLALPYLAKLLLWGIRDIRAGKKAQRAKLAEATLTQSEQQPRQTPAVPPED